MKIVFTQAPGSSVVPTPLAERILEAFPSGYYALSALLRLLDIVESESVPTAAVECVIQPRLLIHPGFVAKHAETPEKLLLLVMHELHHVLLWHTAGLRAGICKTTGGTDIACVAEHMEANRIRRTLIVTDGWVGKPRGHHQQTLSAAKLAVALLGASTNTDDLSGVANFTHYLL
jgi:hypothetical protein